MAGISMTFRLDFDAIKNYQSSFRGQEAAVQQTIGKLNSVIDQLRTDWVGLGATAFHKEMDSEVMPAMVRLQKAMGEGDRVSKEIERTAHETEESIISLFKDMLGKFVGALG